MELTIRNVEHKIYSIRAMQVMLDSDLAELYQTETKYINRAVNRNPVRFPAEFAFQLTEAEWEALRFQMGTINKKPCFDKNLVSTELNTKLLTQGKAK